MQEIVDSPMDQESVGDGLDVSLIFWELDPIQRRFIRLTPAPGALFGYALEAWLTVEFLSRHAVGSVDEWQRLAASGGGRCRWLIQDAAGSTRCLSLVVRSNDPGSAMPHLTGAWVETVPPPPQGADWILDVGDIELYWLDARGRILRANQQAMVSLGYSVEDWSGVHLWDIDPHFSPQRWRRFFEEIQAQGQARFESEHRSRDGRIYPVEMRSRWLRHQEQDCICMLAWDISDRKATELRLRDSEIRYRSFVEHIHGVAFGLLESRRLVFLHGAVTRLTGYPDSYFLSDPASWEGLIDAEDDWVRQAHNRVFAGEPLQQLTFDFRIRRCDGQLAWVRESLTKIFLDNGDCLVHGIWHDVTEERRALEQLQREKYLLEAIIDATPDIIFYKDLHGRYRGCNKSFANFVGHTREEIYGQNDFQLLTGEMATRLQRIDTEVLTSVKTVREEGWLCFPNGEQYLMDTIHAPYFDADREIFGTLGIGRDITNFRNAERALRVSEAKLRSAQKIAGLGSWEHDHVANLVSGSNQVFDFFGIDPVSFGGALSELMERVHGSDRERVMQVRRDSLDSGWPYALEYRVEHPDGREIWLLERGEHELNAAGRPIRTHGTLLEITDRKASETALNRSISMLEATLDATADGIWVTTLNGDTMRCNQRFYDLWRLPHTLVHGANSWGIQHRLLKQLRYPDEYLERWHYLNEHPGESGWDVLECKDGRVFERYSQPRMLEGQAIGRVWSFRDVTESRRIQERLYLQKMALDAAVNSISISDMKGDIQWVNPAFCRITGYSSAEAIGRNQRLLKSDLMPPEFYRDMWDAILRGEVWHGEFHNRRKDGSLYWEEGTISPVYNRNGEIQYFIAIKQDISERKQAEIDNERIRRELLQAQKMEALGQLTGGIAHDFNNLLASILGFAELAQSRYAGVDEKLSDYLQRILHAGNRAKSLVGQMLTFARKQEWADQPLDLAEVLNQDMRLLRSAIPPTINMSFQAEPDLPPVMMDPVQVNQLLMNLCFNARDAIGQQGSIAVELGWQRQLSCECVSCHAHIEGDWIGLSVADTGPGIPPTIIKDIFNPFFTTKEVGKGTGMGLAVVHGIMKGHQGHILLDSYQGWGTRFTLLFPPHESPEAHSTAAHRFGNSQPLSPLQGKIVAVADCSEGCAQWLMQLLEMQGLQVLRACASGELLNLLSGQAVALDGVVMSQKLLDPELGQQLVMRMVEGSVLPVLVLLEEQEAEHHDVAVLPGLKHLRKPLDPIIVLETLESLFSVQAT